MTKKVSNSAGRFGPRYGNMLRKKVNDVESQSRARHDCVYCGKAKSVKRQAYGIWKCGACEKVFVGGAYTPYKGKKVIV